MRLLIDTVDNKILLDNKDITNSVKNISIETEEGKTTVVVSSALTKNAEI